MSSKLTNATPPLDDHPITQWMVNRVLNPYEVDILPLNPQGVQASLYVSDEEPDEVVSEPKDAEEEDSDDEEDSTKDDSNAEGSYSPSITIKQPIIQCLDPSSSIVAARSPLRVNTYALFQSSSSSSQHDELVKPTIFEHNFGFRTNKISPSSIVGESQGCN